MQTEPKGELGDKHLYIAKFLNSPWENEASDELSTLRFGRSLNLPRNESLESGK